MTPLGWIFLLLLAVALAVATALRRRPAARISDAQRLEPRDDRSGLGLSEVRPVSRPVSVPTATPVTVEARATPAAPAAWIDDVLDDLDEDPPLEPTDTEALGAEILDTNDLATDAPATEAQAAEAPNDEAPTDEAPDDAVWTFDASAAPPAPLSGAAFVHTDQTLWPDGADAAALLVASLAAHLGGSVAVVRHDGPAYVVEMLAGAAARAAAPPPMDADGHPLHRIPQDGVLSLLDDADGAALTYHTAAVGQVVARTLAAEPAARVLLVADVPPDAPELDRQTAALVDHYAALLAGLTIVPPAQAWEDDLVDAGLVDGRDFPDADLEADRAEDETSLSADGDEAFDDEMPGGEAPAETGGEAPDEAEGPPAALPPDATVRDVVAQPGARRATPPPPPRAVILNAEMDAARRDRRLLVFALVTLADAETVLRGGSDDVVRAEAALRERLSAAPAVRRVEPFGDLLFGAFLDAEGPEVVRWAERLSGAGKPLLVGAVPAQGSPDLVRAAATDALQSAYEREVTCVVAG